MLNDHTINIVDRYWPPYLGCAPGDFSRSAPVVIQQTGELAGYPGLFALFRRAAPVISVPANDQQRFRSILSSLPQGEIRSPARFALAMAKHGTAVIGPAFIGYADHGTADDHASVAALKAACTEIEWEHGGCATGVSLRSKSRTDLHLKITHL